MYALASAKDPESAVDEARLSGLLGRASTGDADAWREIVRLYARRVYAMAFSRLHNRDVSEEIAQSVLATVAVKVGTGAYTEQGRFEPWLMRVTMNRIRDEARRRGRQATPTDPVALADMREDDGAAAAVGDSNRLGALRAAIETLPDADREVLMMRHHGQMGFKEMAEMLGEPMGTLLARHHRALRKLKDLLAVQEDHGTRGAAPGRVEKAS